MRSFLGDTNSTTSMSDVHTTLYIIELRGQQNQALLSDGPRIKMCSHLYTITYSKPVTAQNLSSNNNLSEGC